MPAALRFQHFEVATRPDGKPVELGRGAMGITYKGFDTNLKSAVALKVINAQYLHSEMARERFLREARAAARLRHQNVASVYHLGQDGDMYFYAMEFVEGETLQARVRREGPLPAREILEIALQVARALAAAQREKLVHRDLKPANIMLADQDGELIVKVIDFGLAKAAEDAGPDGGMRAITMGFVGTPDYASPEQIEEKPLDTRSDLYSLAATMWYGLTGRVMFTGTVPQVMAQQMDRPPPWEWLAPQPPEVVTLLRQMLEKEREQRPSSPVVLRGMIEQCLRTVPITPRASQADTVVTEAPAEPTLPDTQAGTRLTVGSATEATDATLIEEPPPPPTAAPVSDNLTTLKAETTPPPRPPSPDDTHDPAAAPRAAGPKLPPLPPLPEPEPRLEPPPSFDTPPPSTSTITDGPHPAPGALVAKRYKIGARLTALPPQETFRAEDMATGKPVIVRFYEPPSAAEAAGRADLLARLLRLRDEPHPHLLAVLAVEPWNGGHLVVMESPGGSTLADRLRARGQVSRGELVQILEPLAAAADHAALRRIAGIDWTPHNIGLPSPDAAAAPFNLALAPLYKVTLFSIQTAVAVGATPEEENYDMTMVSPAAKSISADFGMAAEALVQHYQQQLVGLVFELLGRPRPRDLHRAAAPIAMLGEAGNAALRRAVGQEAEGGFFGTCSELALALHTQTFAARQARPPMTRAAALRIPPALLGARQRGTLLTLNDLSAADPAPLPLRLVARDEFRLGRLPMDADLVTWFLPRGKENDELSRRLSKVHCLLIRAGNKLLVRDAETSNGTQIDGRTVTKDLPGDPLPEQGLLQLDVKYRVRYQVLPGSPAGAPQIENLAEWSGFDGNLASASQAGMADLTALGGVTFEPEVPPALRRCRWLITALAFGSDPALAIQGRAGHGFHPLQGYLHHHRGGFWLENLEAGGVQVDGVTLAASEIAPLATGQRVRLGGTEFQVVVE